MRYAARSAFHENGYHWGVWADSTMKALQRKGLRNGGARRAVIDLLAEQDCCLTAQEIFDRLRTWTKRVGIASVYRVLDLLTSGPRPAHRSRLRYRALRAGALGRRHHHHLVCDTCGKVEAFEDPGLERAIHRLEETSGTPSPATTWFSHGACGDCR